MMLFEGGTSFVRTQTMAIRVRYIVCGDTNDGTRTQTMGRWQTKKMQPKGLHFFYSADEGTTISSIQ